MAVEDLTVAVILSAYRADTEPSRIDRLRSLCDRLARAYCDPTPKLLGLHDHKGTLSVNWLMPPRTEELGEVIKAWEAENELLSNHYICGALLIADEDDGAPPFAEVADA
jgi:hypothetical protein